MKTCRADLRQSVDTALGIAHNLSAAMYCAWPSLSDAAPLGMLARIRCSVLDNHIRACQGTLHKPVSTSGSFHVSVRGALQADLTECSCFAAMLLCGATALRRRRLRGNAAMLRLQVARRYRGRDQRRPRAVMRIPSDLTMWILPHSSNVAFYTWDDHHVTLPPIGFDCSDGIPTCLGTCGGGWRWRFAVG